MAITITNPNTTVSARSNALGDGVKQQILNWSAISGATSGTITASALSQLYHVLVLGGRLRHSAAPTYSGNVATVAFTVPAETAASRTFQSSMTLTAVADQGAGGNSITLTFTGGATAGAEVVTVTGTAISIQVQSTVSTATQVKAAYDASAAAVALATMSLVGGHSGDTVASASVLPLQNGVTGGGRGILMAIGR